MTAEDIVVADADDVEDKGKVEDELGRIITGVCDLGLVLDGEFVTLDKIWCALLVEARSTGSSPSEKQRKIFPFCEKETFPILKIYWVVRNCMPTRPFLFWPIDIIYREIEKWYKWKALEKVNWSLKIIIKFMFSGRTLRSDVSKISQISDHFTLLIRFAHWKTNE